MGQWSLDKATDVGVGLLVVAGMLVVGLLTYGAEVTAVLRLVVTMLGVAAGVVLIGVGCLLFQATREDGIGAEKVCGYAFSAFFAVLGSLPLGVLLTRLGV